MYKSPLIDKYIEKLGGEVGEFAGWLVPMKFTSYIQEHLAVRRDVGFFDISHMGRIRFKGTDVIDFIQKVYTRDLNKTKTYFMSGPTLALNQWARVKDDEMLYKVSDEEWLVVVNALYREKMINYFREVIDREGYDVIVEDLTFKYGMLAIQGPRSSDVIEKIFGTQVSSLKILEFLTNVESRVGGRVYLVSRSGWTGEDGFEIWGEPSILWKIIEKLLELKVVPCGIISRDSLRIEMGFVLGEHEYGEDPTKWPCAVSLRYGLGAIDWSKHGFIGEEPLRACRREGVRWIRVGIIMKKKHARIIPRQGYRLWIEDQIVGWITSGTYSPVIKRGIGQAYIDTRYAIIGEPISIEVRGKMYEAKIHDFPLIKK